MYIDRGPDEDCADFVFRHKQFSRAEALRKKKKKILCVSAFPSYHFSSAPQRPCAITFSARSSLRLSVSARVISFLPR
jgi:hypothetical protein